MSTSEHLAGPAAAAGTGALVGKVVVARAGLSAAGMVGSGTGVGMAAGPFGMIFGALGGLALYAVLRALGEIGEEYAAEELTRQTVEAVERQRRLDREWLSGWVHVWVEEMVEVTGDEADRFSPPRAERAFDEWLRRAPGDEDRPGWTRGMGMTFGPIMAHLQDAGATWDSDGWAFRGVRLRDLDEMLGEDGDTDG